jgi:hypothetical protein
LVVDAWLADAADSLARLSEMSRERLDLDDETVQTLLDLARIAAHESGERTNAPLLCYLLGLCAASGTDPQELARAVPRSTS